MTSIFTYLGIGVAVAFVVYRIPTFATNWWQVLLALCGVAGLVALLRNAG